MKSSQVSRVAIVGGGAAGSALAFYLARAGLRVVVFDRAGRPPLVVGESMLPAIVPFLRDFGIEEDVAGFGTYKPGATFVFNEEENLSLTFAEVRGAKVTYAYNVPRKELDAAVAESARRAGASWVEASVRLERGEGRDQVRLTGPDLAAARSALGGDPDLIVDATGRARLLPRLLDLVAEVGPRKDTALFAHCEGVSQIVEGNIHVDLCEHGWAWRIPLPGRVSVGFVLDSAHLRTLGSTLEEQYDRLLQDEPMTRAWGPDRRRISDVSRFNNYQLVTKRGVGNGWVLVGDSFGFIDPVFSSGTLLAYHGAKQLAKTIIAGGTREQFERYEARTARHIRSWQETIDHFYDGRLLTLFRVGEYVRHSFVGGLADLHFRKYLPRVFTGEGSDALYGPALLHFMCRQGLLDNDPEKLRVR
jgi:flavin-dependent dehydrogenase